MGSRDEATASLRIYIAGPYGAATHEERERNVRRAIDVGIILLRKGHIPFIPHLTHYVDLRATEIKELLTWHDYIKWDLGWLAVSDALLFLGSSPGADIEYEQAKVSGKIIFHSLDEIPLVRGKDVYRGTT